MKGFDGFPAHLHKASFRGAGNVMCPVAHTACALKPALYAELAASFPEEPPTLPEPVPAGADPGYVRRYLRDLAGSRKLPECWRAFWAHVVTDFCPQFMRLWRHEIRLLYPHLRGVDVAADVVRRGPRRHLLGVEGSQMWRQPMVYDPGLAPHTDGPATLIVAMWYFRHPEDKAHGGDLRFLVPTAHGWMRPLVVPYAANALVTWVNGPAAIHDVTPRQEAEHYRRSVGLAIKLNAKGDVDLFPTIKARAVKSAQDVRAGYGIDLYGN